MSKYPPFYISYFTNLSIKPTISGVTEGLSQGGKLR